LKGIQDANIHDDEHLDSNTLSTLTLKGIQYANSYDRECLDSNTLSFEMAQAMSTCGEGKFCPKTAIDIRLEQHWHRCLGCVLGEVLSPVK